MSRRIRVVLALVAAVPSFTACAEQVTAPARPTIAPAATPAHDMLDPGYCKSGWLSSEGRCA